jgi:hypothetical protein
MIDIQDIHIDDTNWRITANRSGGVTHHLLRDTINDFAKEIENKAKEFAPLGQPPPIGGSRSPGQLKAEGVVRIDSEIGHHQSGDFGIPGEEVTQFPAFPKAGEAPGSSGFTVRGAGGRFTRAETIQAPGYRFTGGGLGTAYVTTAQVILNPAVPHAYWVHQGTGIYGPHHHPIVPRVAPYLVFHWHGRRWEKKSVRGQQPQPFLTEAYVYVNNIYAPAKVSQLRAQLSAEL